MEKDQPLSRLHFTQGIIACVQMTCVIFRQGPVRVLPFYVALTLNKKPWTINDLGLMLMFLNFGKILNSAIFTCITRQNSNILLVAHHYFVITCSMVGLSVLLIAEMGLVPDRQVVLLFVVGCTVVGMADDELLNMQVLITNYITDNVYQQATITHWLMLADPVGWMALYTVFALILQVFGFLVVLLTGMGLAVMTAVLLTTNLFLYWKNTAKDELREAVTNIIEPDLKDKEKDKEKKGQQMDTTLANIRLVLTPSMYVVQMSLLTALTFAEYSFVLVPFVVISKLKTDVTLVGYVASGSNLLSIIIFQIFASLNTRYPVDYVLAFLWMSFGAIAVAAHFNLQVVGLLGYLVFNIGFTVITSLEPSTRVMLSPSWALTRLVGVIGMVQQPLKPVAAVLAPAILAWSPLGGSLVYATLFAVCTAGQLYFYFVQSAILSEKIYVPELSNSNTKKKPAMSRDEINALIQKRRKIFNLSYLEMEQMNYTGQTYDISEPVENALYTAVTERNAVDLFEVIHNPTVSEAMKQTASDLQTTMTLPDVFETMNLDKTVAEPSEFFSVANTIRQLGQMNASIVNQTLQGNEVSVYTSQSAVMNMSSVLTTFTQVSGQTTESFLRVTQQLTSVRYQNDGGSNATKAFEDIIIREEDEEE